MTTPRPADMPRFDSASNEELKRLQLGIPDPKPLIVAGGVNGGAARVEVR